MRINYFLNVVDIKISSVLIWFVERFIKGKFI